MCEQRRGMFAHLCSHALRMRFWRCVSQCLAITCCHLRSVDHPVTTKPHNNWAIPQVTCTMFSFRVFSTCNRGAGCRGTKPCEWESECEFVDILSSHDTSCEAQIAHNNWTSPQVTCAMFSFRAISTCKRGMGCQGTKPCEWDSAWEFADILSSHVAFCEARVAHNNWTSPQVTCAMFSFRVINTCKRGEGRRGTKPCEWELKFEFVDIGIRDSGFGIRGLGIQDSEVRGFGDSGIGG